MNNNDTDILSSTGETYKISKGWRFVLVIGGLAVVALSFYVGILPFIRNTEFSSKDIVLLLIFGPFSALILFTTVYLLINKITIFDGYIVQRNIISEVKIDFSEIVGFVEIPNGGITLYTNNKKRKIEISMMMENYYELTGWVKGRFRRMNVKDIQNNKIFKESKDEFYKKENYLRREKARNTVKVLNILVTISALWTLFLPRPYELSIAVNAAFPIVALIVVQRYKGDIYFDKYKSGIKPSVGLIIIAPSLAMLLRALSDYEIIYSNIFWVYLSALSLFFIGIFVLLALKTKEYSRNKTAFIILPICLILYSSGLILHANCTLDYSEPQRYETTVLGKRDLYGRGRTTYHLTVASWGQLKTESEITVSKNFYYSFIKGDSIFMYEREGVLGVKWYIPSRQ